MARTTPKPLRIFCSYSHKDERYLNELRTWLRGLERQELIEWWHDREISPGWEWEETIDKNLRTAEVILLLVTPAFMASDYVFEREIGKAVERHEHGEARVIPIIVRPADWEWASFGKLQALPKDAKPITTWLNRDQAWLDVVGGIRKAVKELSDERQEQAAKERYRKAMEEAWADNKVTAAEGERLDALASDLGLSADTAADIERDVIGDTKEAILERQEQAAREEERRKRLDGLYDRVRRSHQDQEWQAVVDVFAQIHAEDPAYPDSEGLLRSANEALRRARSAAIEEEPHATESARQKAQELGVNLSQLEGSGAGGRITVKDVVSAAQRTSPRQTSPEQISKKRSSLGRPSPGKPSERRILGSQRRSAQEPPPVTNAITEANADRLRCLRTLGGHKSEVRSVAFSPDGRLLASNASISLRLWQVEDGKLLHDLEGGSSIAFSPDGRLLASGTFRSVDLWRVEDGKLLRELEGHTHSVNRVNSVAFSPDGRLLASGSEDNTVRVWRVEDGKLLRALEGHMHSVNSVAFSPDGRLLASGTFRSVDLWRVKDGKLLRELKGYTLSVVSVAFSPEGRLLASGSWDRTVRLWGIP